MWIDKEGNGATYQKILDAFTTMECIDIVHTLQTQGMSALDDAILSTIVDNKKSKSMFSFF